MSRSVLILSCVVLSSLGSFAFAQKSSSDWKPSKANPIQLAKKAEGMYKTFKNVACGIQVDLVKSPDPSDPKGFGSGRFLLNNYIWSPSKFRMSYFVYAKEWPHLPATEYLAVQGSKMSRLGPEAGPSGLNFDPKGPFFNFKDDASLVEAWPRHYPRLLLAPLAGSNATLTRYLTALTKGVGGYKVTVKERSFAVNGKSFQQYQVLAERKAAAKRPASTVEIIFDAVVGLPLNVHTTYGPNVDLRAKATWLNNRTLPGDPFKIIK